MGVHHAVDIRAVTVDVEMAVRIGRCLEVALDAVAVQIQDDHVLRTQGLVANPRRLDDHVAGLRVPRTHVAAGPRNQIVLGQLHVQLPHFLS